MRGSKLIILTGGGGTRIKDTRARGFRRRDTRGGNTRRGKYKREVKSKA